MTSNYYIVICPVHPPEVHGNESDFTQSDERNNKPLHCWGKNKSLAVNISSNT